MRVFLTGITGFVGLATSKRLLQEGHCVRAAVRDANPALAQEVEQVVFGNLVKHDWASSLEGQEVVIHCAARVYVMKDASRDPLSEFRRVNVEGTLNLARQAAKAGVKRFVFISSIKVNGESTRLGVPYTADDIAMPLDPYGVSKLEAEQKLLSLAARVDMEVSIIRPVLVYGPGVKANFLSMMEWLKKGMPLPLGAIDNKRSLVALDNLVDLILTCMKHPAAANQIFLVSDDEDLSTTELLRRTGKAMGRPARLIPIPSRFLGFSARLLGKPAIVQRLCESLQVDIEKTRDLLGWQPPVSVDEALHKTVHHFLEHQQ
ncbi:TPA: UDP-glucose 4-epimerase family protein [Pseudomonas aeruginosa]